MPGGPHVWYDAAVMFVFLLLAARMLEQRARGARVRAWMPWPARVRPSPCANATGARETIPLEALQPGDIACVAAGAGVPADGALLDAQARFEESLLTGESTPVRKREGDPVFAGTACREVPARMRVACDRRGDAPVATRGAGRAGAGASAGDRAHGRSRGGGFRRRPALIATLVFFAWRAYTIRRARSTSSSRCW